MKKILIIITTLIALLTIVMNYGLQLKMADGIYEKIQESNEIKNKDLGGIKINTKKEDISCSGFIKYTCTLNNPTYGMKTLPTDVLKSKNIIISDISILGDSNVVLNINDLDLIESSGITIKDMFPMTLTGIVKKDKSITDITFIANNNALDLNFKTKLKELPKNDSEIQNYSIEIKNKNLKDLIYSIYIEFMKNPLVSNQIKEMINEGLTNTKTSDIKDVSYIIDGIEQSISNSIGKEITKDNVKNFFNKKDSTLIITAKNKTGISLRTMAVSQGLPIDNFKFEVKLK